MKCFFRKLATICIRVIPLRQRNCLKAVSREPLDFARVALQSLSAVKGYVYGKRMDKNGGLEDRFTVSSSDRLAVKGPNPLESYFDNHATGPGIWKWRHYLGIYHRHLAKFIGREVHVLEIGVYSGGSLDMWRNYFGAKARIYGVDILGECKSYERDTVKIFIGDQADHGFWRRFKREVPAIDVVVDDGGHQADQQIVSLEELLPHLRPGGVYICEDIHGVTNRFHAYIGGLTRNLNAFKRRIGDGELASVPNSFQRLIQSVHLYPFAAVIEKRETRVEQFIAPKRGTSWQPNLHK